MAETEVGFSKEWKPGYRPSNGTEGDWFRGEWCDRCEHDHQFHLPDGGNGEGCEIFLSSIAGEYAYPAENGPPEWQSRWPDGIKGLAERRCTAFEDCSPCQQIRDEAHEKVWPTKTEGQWKPKQVSHVEGQEEMFPR